MRSLGTGLGNIHFVIYTFVLDIYCQQLGDICQLGGVCAPFGHNVGEYTFCNKYICIGYILPTIGECMLVEFIYWYGIYSGIVYILPTIGGYISIGGCLSALWPHRLCIL